MVELQKLHRRLIVRLFPYMKTFSEREINQILGTQSLPDMVNDWKLDTHVILQEYNKEYSTQIRKEKQKAIFKKTRGTNMVGANVTT